LPTSQIGRTSGQNVLIMSVPFFSSFLYTIAIVGTLAKLLAG